MNFLVYISDYIIPLVIFYIIGFGLLQKVHIYDEFVKGAADGLKVVAGILPTLVGLMVAIGMLRASGGLDMIATLLAPVVELIHFPAELVPLVTVKMFSSSAATSLLLDVYKEYGPDSYLGLLASVMMSCSDDGVILRRNKEYLQMQGFGVCPYFFRQFFYIGTIQNISLRNDVKKSILQKRAIEQEEFIYNGR